ncbi:MAG TPA: hypothetical protein VM431_02805 [Phycisphaerae bacterium]|nr:hypothetical protein [Phycisphaerae bacterium]
MTHDPHSADAPDAAGPREPAGSEARPPSAKRLTPGAIAWRVAAIAVVVLVTFALAHYLRQPSRLLGSGGGMSDADFETWPPEVEPSGRPPRPDAVPTDPREAQDDLRQVMAGLVMSALGDDDDPDDSRNQDDEAKRRFIADQFGLPHDYPRSKAPADLMPDEAQVLMVFENPERAGCRMVLVRLLKDIDGALAAFCRHYAAQKWDVQKMNNPDQASRDQPDRGWLVRFTKGKRERIVYARARHNGKETLVAVYDPQY